MKTKLIVAGAIVLAGWGLALGAWWVSGALAALLLLAYAGTAIGIGVGLYLTLPKAKKSVARRLILFLLGTLLFGLALGRALSQNHLFQIEGLFFDLLAGVFMAAVIHYLIAKIIGPLVFGRVWCGWACWTAMILDLLPYKRSNGRLHGRWGWLRYAHFGASLGLVALLALGFGYRPDAQPGAAVYWFLGGNALYYLVGIGLAFALKDNRAFCKYVCPISVPLKLSSRFALLRVKGDPQKCNQRGECIKICPMDIRVSDYVKRGERVLSTECILCQACINVCPHDALTLSFGLERGGKDLLTERERPAGAA